MHTATTCMAGGTLFSNLIVCFLHFIDVKNSNLSKATLIELYLNLDLFGPETSALLPLDVTLCHFQMSEVAAEQFSNLRFTMWAS